MPVPVIVTLISAGSFIVLAPTLLRFLSRLLKLQFSIEPDEQITCWILGGVMTMVAIIASVVPTRKSGSAAGDQI